MSNEIYKYITSNEEPVVKFIAVYKPTVSKYLVTINILPGVNDKLRYTNDNWETVFDIKFPKGVYHITEIRDMIYNQIKLNGYDGYNPVKFKVNTRLSLNRMELIMDTPFIIDPSPPSSITKTPGFDLSFLKSKTYIGSNNPGVSFINESGLIENNPQKPEVIFLVISEPAWTKYRVEINIVSGVNDKLRYSNDNNENMYDIKFPEGLHSIVEINNIVQEHIEKNGHLSPIQDCETCKDFYIETPLKFSVRYDELNSITISMLLFRPYAVDPMIPNSITETPGFNLSFEKWQI